MKKTLFTENQIIAMLKQHEQAIIIIVLVIVNFLVKGIFLLNNSLGGDEPFSVYHAQMNIASIIKLLSEGNNPPLYEILLHFWIKNFGISELSVRFPSLIFSCTTVLFIYKIGFEYLNKRVAFYASIIFIFSNYHILFAHEARVYAFLGMLTAISMYFFMGILDDYRRNSQTEYNNIINKKTTSKFIILSILNTLIIYSHYFGFFVLMIQFIFLILNLPILFKFWKKLLLSAGIIALLYSPNILVLFNRFIDSSSGTWVKPVENLGNLFDLIYLFSNNIRIVYLLVISIVLVAAWKLFYHLKANKYVKGFFLIGIIPLFFLTSYSIFFQIPFIWKLTSNIVYTIGFLILVLCVNIICIVVKEKTKMSKNSNYSFIVFWFVFIFFFMFGISFTIPMFLDRYLMIAAIAFPLFLGISTDYIIKTPVYKFIIPVILISSFIVTVKPNITNKRNVKETVEKIKALKTSNTTIYFCPDWFELNFVYYYNIEYFKDYDDVNIKYKIYQYLHSENIFPLNNHNQIDNNLNKNADKIIYLDAAADFHYPKNNIKKELDLNYHLKSQYKFNETFRVFEYELK